MLLLLLFRFHLRLMENYPNTYALSKAYAEDVVYSYRKKFPVVISRPSIVISAWKQPYPGLQMVCLC